MNALRLAIAATFVSAAIAIIGAVLAIRDIANGGTPFALICAAIIAAALAISPTIATGRWFYTHKTTPHGPMERRMSQLLDARYGPRA